MLIVRRDLVVDFFFCVFLALAGLGNYYNNLYQIGGIVVMADIGLVLFIGTQIVLNYELYFDRKHSYLIMCFMALFVIGLISGHAYSDIFRDVKVVMYFFTAYMYCLRRKNSYQFISRVAKTILIVIAFTIVACGMDFFQYGVSGISSNQILRTFGLGLSQTGLAAIYIIFWAGGDLIKRKIGKTLYYGILFSCIILTVTSYTRSNWMLLICSFLGYYTLRFFRNPSLGAKTVIRGIVYFFGACLVLLLIYQFLQKSYPKIVEIIVARANSIVYFGTGMSYNGNADTFSDRMSELLKYSDKFLNPMILLGWGFGDRVPGDASTIIENSFLYYTWKYGIIWSCVLFYKVCCKFREILDRNNKLNDGICASLISYFVFGGLSGHLNKYYMLPYIAILLVVDFSSFLKGDSEESVLV